MYWQNIPAALLSLSSISAARPLSSHTVSSLLGCYDFSTVEVALVASIPGKHDGWPAAQKVGHTGLMSAVNDINAKCPPGCSLNIEYLVGSGGLMSR
jgi:tyrosyl-DNA phosphodiesterase-1